jgi:ppGpp synthetase/RelA/SpoT-type nucleotidyltranferase
VSAPPAKSPEAWGEEYRQVRPEYERFCAKFEGLIRDLLAGAEIAFAQIEPRTKSVESFVEKIRRKNEKYADPLQEITDLAGLRVIAYFPADVAQIGGLLEEHFAVDWDNSRRQSGASDPDRFGYRSDHYVVRFSGERLALPENQRFTGHVAEIQVRTVMQHAWAAVDHRLRYKNTAQLPEELRRRLYRLSALLEVADDQFAAVKQAADELEAAYTEEVRGGDLSAELDVLSLEAFLRETGLAERWVEIAVGAGFSPMWGSDPGNLSLLAQSLSALGVETLADVERLFAAALDWAPPFLAQVQARSVARGFLPVAAPFDILTFVALARAPSADAILATPYAAPIKEAIVALRA